MNQKRYNAVFPIGLWYELERAAKRRGEPVAAFLRTLIRLCLKLYQMCNEADSDDAVIVLRDGKTERVFRP